MRRLILLAAACGGSPSPPPTGPITATVTHYDYTFDVDSRAAHATVTATVTTAGDCWTLPFRAMSPANVTLDGKAAQATNDTTTITACGTGYKEDATLVLDADVTFALATLGPSQVGYSIKKDAQGNNFYYLVSWVGGCDQFSPCDNRPDQFATYHFTVTHPAGYLSRCPGTVTDDSPTQSSCDFTLPGGPTYSGFGVATYPAWTTADLGMWNDVHVTLYDRSQTGIAARIDNTWHSGYIAWMESQFGPWPYAGELRLLTAPTYWNGFEHPGNIVLNDTLAKQTASGYSDPVQHVIDHEMTHMWAGDQTTLGGTYDFVWKESMAEYLSYVYEDMQNPTTGDTTAKAWKSFGQAARYYPVPLDHPDLFTYYSDVYGPGPMVLFRQLEVLSSRQQVLDAIKDVISPPAHAIAVTDLIAALQAHTGLDLSNYTLAWIQGSGAPAWPRYFIQYTDNGNGMASVFAHLTNNITTVPRGCMFHVALHGATADQVATVAIDTFHNAGDVTVPITTPAFTVVSIEIDPLHECLVYLDSSSPRTEPPIEPWVAPPDTRL